MGHLLPCTVHCKNGIWCLESLLTNMGVHCKFSLQNKNIWENENRSELLIIKKRKNYTHGSIQLGWMVQAWELHTCPALQSSWRISLRHIVLQNRTAKKKREPQSTSLLFSTKMKVALKIIFFAGTIVTIPGPSQAHECSKTHKFVSNLNLHAWPLR